MGIEGLYCLRMDAFRYLKESKEQFDVVFADPPYQLEVQEKLHRMVMQSEVLASNGLFIMEHSERTAFDNLSGFIEQRKYGHVNFSFYKQSEE
jgi:16S rRNA G966 N2-methylase RsmD